MKDKYHISVEYAKAWRAKCKAIKAIYGDWDESYNLLPRFLDAIKEANPANEFILFCEEFGHERMFKCVFWAFGSRPLISVDGTHLYGKYPHCLLIATTLDGNNGLFPLAFAIVESENQKSWEWFLACLDRFVIKGKKPFTLISDRQKGLLMAVQRNFLPSECFHRFCVHHLVANFKKTLKNDTLNALIWSAARKTNIIEFDRTMELIEQQSERAKELLTEGPLRPEFWSLGHDDNVRFGVLTTNMSESFNNVLRVVGIQQRHRGTYAIGFYPHKDKLYWPNTGVRVVPPIARKQPGRPRSIRIRTKMDKGERATSNVFSNQVKLLLEMLIKKCGLNACKKDDSDDEEKEHYDDE
ncbi:uncharacterized protein [Aristolochia californica]|uniref:uncharacterized protein n=1 Tax=Aristolochia californica TaxID=171875 RepID=UPI0035D587F1